MYWERVRLHAIPTPLIVIRSKDKMFVFNLLHIFILIFSLKEKNIAINPRSVIMTPKRYR